MEKSSTRSASIHAVEQPPTPADHAAAIHLAEYLREVHRDFDELIPVDFGLWRIADLAAQFRQESLLAPSRSEATDRIVEVVAAEAMRVAGLIAGTMTISVGTEEVTVRAIESATIQALIKRKCEAVVAGVSSYVAARTHEAASNIAVGNLTGETKWQSL